MEYEVKIKESEDAQNSFVEKIKSNKNLMIICGVVFIVLLLFFLFKGNKSSGSGGRQLSHYDYLIVGSGLYGPHLTILQKRLEKLHLLLKSVMLLVVIYIVKILKEFLSINMVLMYSILITKQFGSF